MPTIEMLKETESVKYSGISDTGFTKIKWYADIWLEQGMLDGVLQWCKIFAPREWRWEGIEFPSQRTKGHYRFFFEEERDYLQFLLAWS